MAKKMNMRQWEKSAMDEKMDKSGKYGKEGSKSEQAADRKALARFNKGKK